jgi:hypothetical protein
LLQNNDDALYSGADEETELEDLEEGDGDTVIEQQNEQQSDSRDATAVDPPTGCNRQTKCAKRSLPAVDVPVKQLTNLAASAGRALMQLTSRRENIPVVQTVEKLNDKDYAVAMLLYNKMKDIPDGEEKDELHIELQRMVNQTKRNVSLRASQLQGFNYTPGSCQPATQNVQYFQQPSGSFSQQSGTSTFQQLLGSYGQHSTTNVNVGHVAHGQFGQSSNVSYSNSDSCIN